MPTITRVDLPSVDDRPSGRRQRRRERRRLGEQDQRVARRAELYLVGTLLEDACALVDSGWVQHCWFTVTDDDGGRRRVGPQNLHEMRGRAPAEVCLVGALVQAGGGVARAASQPVHRALDLTWATLHNQPVRWCPSPAVRLAHVHDLTRWNDARQRTSDDVAALLALARCRAADATG